MIESVLLFVAGLVILVKGSDFFVDAAAKIAKIFGVSDLVIGLTIVAIGTSLPEISASIFAALSNETNLAIGTVVGSNIANIVLVMGIAAVLYGRIQVEKKAFEKDIFFLILVTVLFYYFSFDGLISAFEGYIMVGIFIAYMLFLLGFMKRFAPILDYERFLKYFLDMNKFSLFNVQTYLQIMKAGIDPKTYKKLLGLHEPPFEEKLGKRIESGEKTEAKKIYQKQLLSTLGNQLIFLFIGGLGIFFGAQILIQGAVDVATFFDVPKATIGLFLVAIGTSLPELGVSLSAVRKGYAGILVGNIVGSNISNILLVAGTTSIVSVLSFSFAPIAIPMFFMLLVTLLLAAFVQRDYDINRLIGVLFLVIYAIFLYYLYTTLL